MWTCMPVASERRMTPWLDTLGSPMTRCVRGSERKMKWCAADIQACAAVREAGGQVSVGARGARGGEERTAVDPAELLLADEDVWAAVVVVGAFGHVRRDVILLRANA